MAISILVLGFLTVNFTSLYKNLRYSIDAKYFSKANNLADQSKMIIEANDGAEITDNLMIIPKIGIKAPISWDMQKADLATSLESGLLHLDSSSKPSDPSGNVFIIGDSSSPWWQKNLHQEVFALLNHLEKGDRINITYQKKFYVYQVRAKLSVKSEQVELMQANDSQRLLTLMTDTPIGINLKKLVVIAELLSTNEQSIKKIQDEILESSYFDPLIFIES